jgi:hypothetical protein
VRCMYPPQKMYTGHVTKAAMELGSLSSLNDIGNEIAVMFFFCFGAAVTGFVIGKEKLTLGQSYGRLMCAIGTIIFIAMYQGETATLTVLFM